MIASVTNAPSIIYQLVYYEDSDTYSIMSNADCSGQTIEVYADDTLIVSGTLGESTFKDDVYESDITAATQTALVEADAYKIVLNGAEYQLNMFGDTLINLPTDFYFVASIPSGAGIKINAINLSESADISISQTITKTVKHYDTKLLPDELLPNTAARKSDVSKAAATADAAQTAAGNAQITAEAAQTAANNAQTAADNAVHPAVQSDVAWYYLKNPDNQNPVNVLLGNTGGAGLQISIGDSTTPKVVFTPPAIGLKQADFEFKRANSYAEHPLITGIGGIIINSATPASAKKFKITVDDTGTLSATEVT